MDLNAVRIFVRVVDDGGFTAAATALKLPKSSVSRAVSQLEEELGTRLLQRSTRRISLTDAGAAFYERASRGLAAVAEAKEVAVDLAKEVRGTIRVTTSVDAGVWLLAPIVASFIAKHPAVSVDVALTNRVVDMVHEGFDLALRAGPVRDETLVARKLATLDFGLYAAKTYLAEHGAPTSIAQLAQHRCVLFRATRGHASWTLEGRGETQTIDVEGPVNADDFTFLRQCIVAGLGIGLLPSFLAEHCPTGPIERVLPEHVMRGAPFHVVYPAARHLPRRVALLRDQIVAQLG